MRRVLTAALAVLVLALPAAANPLKSLTGRADILGWEAVGRLNMDGRGYCSASLIAPTTVLTAAHCLFGADHEKLDPTALTFHAGLRDGESIASRAVARAVVPDGYDPANPGEPESVRNDVALLELASPIPATTADPFPLARAGGVGREVTVLSYGQGRSNAMSREIGCRTIAAQASLYAFDCQAHPGSSGAPIFDMSGPSPRILSIVSGLGRFQGGRAVFGMELGPVVAGLERAFRTGEGVWPRPEPTRRKTVGLNGGGSAGNARFLKPYTGLTVGPH